MNIRIDPVLAPLIKAAALRNRLSVDTYVNGLLGSTLNVEIALAEAKALDEKRCKVVESLWHAHEFPKDVSIDGRNGWSSEGGNFCMEYCEKFFYKSNRVGYEGSTLIGFFRVYFDGTSTTPTSVIVRDQQNNNL